MRCAKLKHFCLCYIPDIHGPLIFSRAASGKKVLLGVLIKILYNYSSMKLAVNCQCLCGYRCFAWSELL